jgi:hypothetical protein
MIWVLVWTVLVLGSAGVLFVLGRRLWRQTKALTSQLGAAADRLAEVTDRLADLEQARETVAEPPDGVGSPSSRRRP